jgi:putative transcriptional regulator
MTDKKKLSPLARDILEGLHSALAHAKGKPTPGSVEHVVLVPDVKAIREALGLSQSEFSETYNIPLPTLKGWEQGRRHPDTTAAAYIRTIALFPKETRRAQTAEIKAITKQRGHHVSPS